MKFSIVELIKLIFNYKLIYNFTIIQIISLTIMIFIVLQFSVNNKLSYIVYLLFYLNLNRIVLNNGIIGSDRGFILFNLYVLVSLYFVYFFRKELAMLREKNESFSKKLTDITYGKLFEKHSYLNYFFFFEIVFCLYWIICLILKI